MRLIDIKSTICLCEILRDCDFDTLGLVGKEYSSLSKVISFLGDEHYIKGFIESGMVGVICTPEIAEKIKDIYLGGICISETPKTLFFKYHNYLATNTNHFGDVKTRSIGMDSRIHESAMISENDVVIGNNVTIAANAIIHSGVEISDNVIIREGCVVGSPAFYYFDEGDKKTLVQSVGKVQIKENAELHPMVVIEKGVLGGSTLIAKNVKIGSNAVIEHNSVINENTTICSGVKFAGGVTIGKNSFVGVGALVAPNIKIGDNVKISIGSVVTKMVQNETHVSGNFAIEHQPFIKHLKTKIKDAYQEIK